MGINISMEVFPQQDVEDLPATLRLNGTLNIDNSTWLFHAKQLTEIIPIRLTHLQNQLQ